MSFCATVKEELAQAKFPRECCRRAFAYGMLQGAHAFSVRDISVQTEHRAVARAYAGVFSVLFPSVCVNRQSVPRKAGSYYTVSVKEESARREVLGAFGHTGQETAMRLNRANLECDFCPGAYLRGLFLSCGALTDPQADYHAEFSLPYRLLSMDILALLREQDLSARHIMRKGANVIYLKDGEQIADLLTLIGAQSGSLSLYRTMTVKNIRNTANRRTNCDSANLSKTAAASSRQLIALEKIETHGGFNQLPEELRQLAVLRSEHPEYSLRELGEALSPPLSRSGVNHRLGRILDWAENL